MQYYSNNLNTPKALLYINLLLLVYYFKWEKRLSLHPTINTLNIRVLNMRLGFILFLFLFYFILLYFLLLFFLFKLS